MKRAILMDSERLGFEIGEGPKLGLPLNWEQQNRNDLWSIGMICYSIMYGDNAIFPNEKIRFPLNPAFPMELKRAIEILLERENPVYSNQIVLKQI